MLDNARFPADTLSTHLLSPAASPSSIVSAPSSGFARWARRRCPRRSRAWRGHRACAVASGAVDGIDYALCVRRPGLDSALVETAREAGAELRERVRVVDLIRECGRVAGVRCVDAGGDEHELRAPAGGRR